MSGLLMNQEIIHNANTEAVFLLKESLGNDLVKIIRYGSCARGDYTDD